MTGWTLADENDNTYNFPDNFILRREHEVRVWTASGVDTTTDLHWGRSSGVWSSKGDTAFLRDPEGELVDSFTWTGDDSE
ncbi:MAG TPA: lamin tail domain-containing protein [Chloroflexi bacterium]|nr:lamin tail domain-containing protein [Chloroflexota bacterium]